eukprot:gene16903-23180_t
MRSWGDFSQMCKAFVFHVQHNCTFETKMATPCINGCNTPRGRCQAGWCHCQPGFYGADCSLSLDPGGKSQLLAGAGYEPRKRKPWIYVYELPPRFNTWINIRSIDRPLDFMFHQRILSSGSQVADGEQADYFYM